MKSTHRLISPALCIANFSIHNKAGLVFYILKLAMHRAGLVYSIVLRETGTLWSYCIMVWQIHAEAELRLASGSATARIYVTRFMDTVQVSGLDFANIAVSHSALWNN